MLTFALHNDQTLSDRGSFLEVPAYLIDALLNSQTNADARISDDCAYVYLPLCDHEKIFDRLNQIGETHQTQIFQHKGPCFVRELSKIAWV